MFKNYKIVKLDVVKSEVLTLAANYIFCNEVECCVFRLLGYLVFFTVTSHLYFFFFNDKLLFIICIY